MLWRRTSLPVLQTWQRLSARFHGWIFTARRLQNQLMTHFIAGLSKWITCEFLCWLPFVVCRDHSCLDLLLAVRQLWFHLVMCSVPFLETSVERKMAAAQKLFSERWSSCAGLKVSRFGGFENSSNFLHLL